MKFSHDFTRYISLSISICSLHCVNVTIEMFVHSDVKENSHSLQ